jgi:hypothetical protein
MATSPPRVHLAEIVGVLALAQDGAFAQPADALLRAATISRGLADRIELAAAEREAARWAAPLRYVGCTGHSHETSVLFGDDIELRARSLLSDPSNPAEVLREIVKHAGEDRSPLDRVRTVLATLAGGRGPAALNFRTACEVGDALAARLGVPDGARVALRFGFERWNGRGFPDGAKLHRYRRSRSPDWLAWRLPRAQDLRLLGCELGVGQDPAIAEVCQLLQALERI